MVTVTNGQGQPSTPYLLKFLVITLICSNTFPMAVVFRLYLSAPVYTKSGFLYVKYKHNPCSNVAHNIIEYTYMILIITLPKSSITVRKYDTYFTHNSIVNLLE